MATDALRSLWAEPRPTNAPDRRPRDWALVAVLICWSLVEVVLRQDLAPRPLLLLAVLAVLGPLLWRRTHPLVAVAVSFGTLTIVDIVRILTGSQGGHLTSIPPSWRLRPRRATSTAVLASASATSDISTGSSRDGRTARRRRSAGR